MMRTPADDAIEEPLRSQVDESAGWSLLEFGAGWCGHCQAARPLVDAFITEHRLVSRWVEDGKGRPLGRSFSVKLWPTLVLLHDGKEVARVVRPRTTADLAPLAAALAS